MRGACLLAGDFLFTVPVYLLVIFCGACLLADDFCGACLLADDFCDACLLAGVSFKVLGVLAKT